MKVHWIIKETAGAILLLSAVIYLPVLISDYTAPKSIPFRPKQAKREMINLVQSKPETGKAIVRTLAAQLHALRAKDFKKAYEYSSKGIRQTMSLGEFERMVQIRFAPMMDFDAVETTEAYDDGEQGFIRARLSQGGIPTAIYNYIMASEEDEWRIGGVIPDQARKEESFLPDTQAPSTSSSVP